MKKTYNLFFTILGALLLLPPAEAAAQQRDARGRSAETVVADGLAQLPAPTQEVFNQVMGEIAATGSRGVETIASMMTPSAKGRNAVFEHALSGVAAYVTAPGRETLREGVRKGFLAAIERCGDDANRAFLLAQLQLCAEAEDAPAIAVYLNDPYLADYALRALIATPGSEEVLLSAAREGGLSQERRRALAYALGVKSAPAAEPILLGWLEDAQPQTAAAIYAALAACGTESSLKPLNEAAARVGYAPERTGATDAYLKLLSRLVKTGNPRAAVRAARKVHAKGSGAVRGAALEILVEAEGVEKSLPLVIEALRTGPAEYRYAALQALGEGDEAVFEAVAADFPRYDAAAQRAVVAWLGERGAVGQSDVIAGAVSSPDSCLAKAAIEASGRIGGRQALEALTEALEGPHAAEARRALLSFRGAIDERVARLFECGEGRTIVAALELAASRRMTALADRVFALLASDDAQIRSAAYRALPFVVGPDDADRLARLLDSSSGERTAQVQTALIRALAPLPQQEQSARIERYMQVSKLPAGFYPVLAHTAADSAIEKLLVDFRSGGSREAFDALLAVDSPQMIDILYDLAAENPALADRALMRYADLTAAAGMTPERRYQSVRRALELAPSAAVACRLLANLNESRIEPALMLAASYLSDPRTALAAAGAVRTIVAKASPMPGGAAVRRMLEEARDIYRAVPDADAGYAADEIVGLLEKLPETGFTPLSAGDLSEWKPYPEPVAGKPTIRARVRAEQAAAACFATAWKASDGVIAYAGGKPCAIATANACENFEMWLEWRSQGAAGIAVRSVPMIGLGLSEGGKLPGRTTALAAGTAAADNPSGEWNTLYIRVTDDRMTVVENGVVTAANLVMHDPLRPGEAIAARGPVCLMGSGAPVFFRGILLHELPPTPVFELSAEEKAEGYEVLFDGRSLHKWTGNTTDYVPHEGTIGVTASYGGTGNLYTKREYADFNLRFEFRFLEEGVNNGIGIRTPMDVDAAYYGMEIQVLDHDAPIYKGLMAYQQHGSVYGIIPARHMYFPERGTWNTMEIDARGDRIRVTVNGEVIVDGDIREACRGHNVSPDGSEENPYTVDRRNHPGLFNRKGHISFCGHGAGIQFRRVRVREYAPLPQMPAGR